MQIDAPALIISVALFAGCLAVLFLLTWRQI
jgi:hypothetical protein